MKMNKTLVLVVMTAGLSMGNESCKQAETRVLKMDVETGQIAAQPIRLPSGEVINFPYIANSLFYRSVMASDHFVMTNPVPSPQQYVQTGAVVSAKATAGTTSAMSPDESVLAQYGFMKSMMNSGSLDSSLEGKSIATKAEAASVPDSQLPACLYDLPQSQIKGEVVSFEATWGAGIGIGYGAGGTPVNPGGTAGSVNFNQSQLNVGLRAEDPLDGRAVAQASGISNQSAVKFGLDFSAGSPIGLDLFFKTPLASVVSSAFDKALKAIIGDFVKMSNLGTWEDTWESRVLYNPEIVDNDTYIAFRGGTNYAMKIGDTFKVTNMYYKWDRDPCTSALQYRITRTPTPVAEAEVINVGNNVAVARITKYLIEQRIEPGAQVKLLKYFVPPTPTPAPTK